MGTHGGEADDLRMAVSERNRSGPFTAAMNE